MITVQWFHSTIPSALSSPSCFHFIFDFPLLSACTSSSQTLPPSIIPHSLITPVRRSQCNDHSATFTVQRTQFSDNSETITVHWSQWTDRSAMITVQWSQCSDNSEMTTPQCSQCNDHSSILTVKWSHRSVHSALITLTNFRGGIGNISFAEQIVTQQSIARWDKSCDLTLQICLLCALQRAGVQIVMGHIESMYRQKFV